MSNFKVGDKVTRKDDAVMYNHLDSRPVGAYPTYGEIVEVNEVTTAFGYTYLGLVEYEHLYDADDFRRIEPSKQKASYRLANLEILTQFPVIKERSDQPLTQPVETQYEIEEV